VEADNLRARAGLEMAANGVLDQRLELLHRFRLRENRVPQGVGFVATLGRFLDKEDDFGFGHVLDPRAGL